jgi:molecular chaperone HtpG
VIDKLIPKADSRASKLSKVQQEDIKSVFNIKLTSKEIYNVVPETLDENDSPVIITQSEFMRRMKEMSQLGGGMNFYGELPDSYNLVVNLNHPLVMKISDDLESVEGAKAKEK